MRARRLAGVKRRHPTRHRPAGRTRATRTRPRRAHRRRRHPSTPPPRSTRHLTGAGGGAVTPVRRCQVETCAPNSPDRAGENPLLLSEDVLHLLTGLLEIALRLLGLALGLPLLVAGRLANLLLGPALELLGLAGRLALLVGHRRAPIGVEDRRLSARSQQFVTSGKPRADVVDSPSETKPTPGGTKGSPPPDTPGRFTRGCSAGVGVFRCRSTTSS